VDKNMKLWTNISSLLMNIQVNLESVFHVFVYNFIFLSTFSRKLYEHLNMFIQIDLVSWHLCNNFIIFYLNQPKSLQNKKKKPNFIISNLNQNQPNPQKNIKPNKTFYFYYFQTLTKSSKPSQIQSNPNFKYQNFVIPKPK
jgi:hypothetical protein